MKKLFVVILLAILGVTGMQAQKTTVKIRDTQARLLDVKSNAYVRPLVVELKVDSTNRVVDQWSLSKEQVEVEMNGDLTNIRSWGIYKSSQLHQSDVIVAATFNFETDDKKPGFYKLTVIGYPASFVNWETAKESDYEWIRMEKTVTTSEREKISAIVK